MGIHPRFSALVTAITSSPELGPKFKDVAAEAEAHESITLDLMDTA